jgi:hypothetical protein
MLKANKLILSASAELLNARSVELPSSFSSVKTRIATRVLGARAVDFDAIAPRVFARMRASAGVATPALLASIRTIDHAGGGLKGKRTFMIKRKPQPTFGLKGIERGGRPC